jgi:hypothetical protein
MTAFYLILAVSSALLLCAVAFLALIVAGIRKGDRGDLKSPSSNRIDAITRRVISVGVRNDAGNEGSDN